MTAETFLAWEDRQEGRYEFDGRDVIPMTGGSLAHQRIVGNLWMTLPRLLARKPFQAAWEMRLQIGGRVRHPDVIVFSGPLDQSTRTLTDAVVIFEVLSDDTAATDRVTKLIDYAEVPSLWSYVLLEQTAIAATVPRREQGDPWVASAHAGGDLALPKLNIALPLAAIYEGLTFAA